MGSNSEDDTTFIAAQRESLELAKKDNENKKKNTVIKAIILLPLLIDTISALQTIDDKPDGEPSASTKEFYNESHNKFNDYYEEYKKKVMLEEEANSKKYNIITTKLVEGNFLMNFDSKEAESIGAFKTKVPIITTRSTPCNSQQLDKMIKALAILEVITYSNRIIIMENLRAIVLEYLIQYCPDIKAFIQDRREPKVEQQQFSDTGAGVGFRTGSLKEGERLQQQQQQKEVLTKDVIEEIRYSSEQDILDLLEYLNIEISIAKADPSDYDKQLINDLPNFLIDEVIKSRTVDKHIVDLDKLTTPSPIELLVSELKSQESKDEPHISINSYTVILIHKLIEFFEIKTEELSLSREEVIVRKTSIDRLIAGLDETNKAKTPLTIYSKSLEKRITTLLELELELREQFITTEGFEEAIKEVQRLSIKDALKIQTLLKTFKEVEATMDTTTKARYKEYSMLLEQHIELELERSLENPQRFDELNSNIGKLTLEEAQERQRLIKRLQEKESGLNDDKQEIVRAYGISLDEYIKSETFKQSFDNQAVEKLISEIPNLTLEEAQERQRLLNRLKEDLPNWSDEKQAKFKEYSEILDYNIKLKTVVFSHDSFSSDRGFNFIRSPIYTNEDEELHSNKAKQSTIQRLIQKRESLYEREIGTIGGKKSRKQIKSRKSRKQRISRKQRRQRKSRKFRKLIKSKTL